MTTLTDRAFLRLHIEAVWGISIPPLDSAMVELSTDTSLPPWSLYLARLDDGAVTIWRPDNSPEERADLLERALQAGPDYDAAPGMRREVVLRISATPPTSPARSQPVARHLTAADAPLLEAFEAGSASYFLDPHHAPCLGVIVGGRLVSVAHSSRRTPYACELGINTAPDARNHGYATTAVRAWTESILRERLTPIHSAFAHNTPSLRLAAAADYIQVSASVYGPVTNTTNTDP
jgi:hypothetical protein